ncbi:HVA22-like protein e [Eucalyptus grandis]|uniref:HVA22-like protein e n=1 Tax=Eucalyptus grandis TaxID=71139 RepID=UPI00192E7DED|nr:HVA22-like protein e [Eucalyptus grandis]
MGHLWTILTHAHSLAGPVLMLLYPLYASVMAIESPSKIDDEQWLAYWILYSFLTLVEMAIQPLFEWIPIWYDVKLILVAWLVLPQFQGAAFLYERLVREHILKRQPKSKSKSSPTSSPNAEPKSRKKFVDFIIPKKGSTRRIDRSMESLGFSAILSFTCQSFLLCFDVIRPV